MFDPLVCGDRYPLVFQLFPTGFARLSTGGFIGMPSSARVVGPVAVLCSSGNGYRTFISAAEKESTTFQNSLALALVSMGATLFGFHRSVLNEDEEGED